LIFVVRKREKAVQNVLRPRGGSPPGDDYFLVFDDKVDLFVRKLDKICLKRPPPTGWVPPPGEQKFLFFYDKVDLFDQKHDKTCQNVLRPRGGSPSGEHFDGRKVDFDVLKLEKILKTIISNTVGSTL